MNADGLAGCKKLTGSDHIIIFFTKNAMKINMSDIADHGTAKLEMVEIPAGKQSVDIHIGSYLGYLAGTHRENACRIVVVSKDNDFDNPISFWKSRTGLDISRVKQIKSAAPVKTQSPAPEKTQSESPSSKEKTELNNAVTQALAKVGYGNEIVGYVSSAAVKNMGKKTGKALTYRALVTKFGQEKGLEIYKHIKKIV